jgi:hypothetical protein
MIILWPFKETSDNIISLFNELMNSSHLCILLSLSGLQPVSEVRDQLGWGLVCVSLLTVFANFAKLIYIKGSRVLRLIIQKRKTRENKSIIE